MTQHDPNQPLQQQAPPRRNTGRTRPDRRCGRHRRHDRDSGRLRGRVRRVVGLMLAALTLVALPVGADAGSIPAPQKPSASKAVSVDYGSGLWAGPTGPVVTYGDPGTADILIVGDSIAARCYPALVDHYAGTATSVAVVAQAGQNTQGLVDLLQGLPAVSPKVVMEAGTNDVFDPPAMAAQVARARTWVEDVQSSLTWVDTYVGRSATVAADSRNSGWVNGQIYAGAPKVAAWLPALGAAVGRGRALSYYLQDGVHPWVSAGAGHGDGCAFWAAVVASGVAS